MHTDGEDGAHERVRTADLHITNVAFSQLNYAGEENGAVNGTRTRDSQHGKLVLYQLSYHRMRRRRKGSRARRAVTPKGAPTGAPEATRLSDVCLMTDLGDKPKPMTPRRPTLYRMAASKPTSRALEKWSGRPDSNRRPPVPRTGALPCCATARQRQKWDPAGRRTRTVTGA